MRVLVTGANGFVGRALCRELHGRGHDVVAASRSGNVVVPCTTAVTVGTLDGATNWRDVLAGCDAVVHLAARVHVMHETEADASAAFRAVNTDGTLNLARQAAEAGVRRFVFASSIKVNGEGRETPYSAADVAAPQDAYARSKWEAELGLCEIAASTGLEAVILRIPLVYGAGVGANFLRLMRTLDKGLPLPLGRVGNRRSLVYLGNLVDAMALCLTHPAAANKTYLVSDGEDVSTPQLIRRLSAALGRTPRLLPVPPSWLCRAGRLLGKGPEMERLLGSLAVDSRAMREELGWTPPFSMEAGLAKTVECYRAEGESP